MRHFLSIELTRLWNSFVFVIPFWIRFSLLRTLEMFEQVSRACPSQWCGRLLSKCPLKFILVQIIYFLVTSKHYTANDDSLRAVNYCFSSEDKLSCAASFYDLLSEDLSNGTQHCWQQCGDEVWCWCFPSAFHDYFAHACLVIIFRVWCSSYSNREHGIF